MSNQKKKSETLSIRIHSTVYDRIESNAKKGGLSKTKWLEDQFHGFLLMTELQKKYLAELEKTRDVKKYLELVKSEQKFFDDFFGHFKI